MTRILSFVLIIMNVYIFTNFYTQKNIRDSLVARITACRVVDRGSIPRRGAFYSANGLVVKSNVAIVGPPVRFRVCASFYFLNPLFFQFLQINSSRLCTQFTP